MDKDVKVMIAGLVFLVLSAIVTISALVNHVIFCIREEHWILLIVGVIAAPVGFIHGVGLWFGWF